MALEAIDIVSRIEETVTDYHVAAIHYVDSVIVPIRLGVHMDPFHKDVAALVVLLVPATRIPQGQVTDDYSFAFVEMDVLRTLSLLQTVVS